MGGKTRGKVDGQIDRFKAELERNARLYHVFSICLELGIDDPIHWMNNTSNRVVDWWVAFKHHKFEIESKTVDSSSNPEMDGEQAGQYLSQMLGKK